MRFVISVGCLVLAFIVSTKGATLPDKSSLSGYANKDELREVLLGKLTSLLSVSAKENKDDKREHGEILAQSEGDNMKGKLDTNAAARQGERQEHKRFQRPGHKRRMTLHTPQMKQRQQKGPASRNTESMASSVPSGNREHQRTLNQRLSNRGSSAVSGGRQGGKDQMHGRALSRRAKNIQRSKPSANIQNRSFKRTQKSRPATVNVKRQGPNKAGLESPKTANKRQYGYDSDYDHCMDVLYDYCYMYYFYTDSDYDTCTHQYPELPSCDDIFYGGDYNYGYDNYNYYYYNGYGPYDEYYYNGYGYYYDYYNDYYCDFPCSYMYGDDFYSCLQTEAEDIQNGLDSYIEDIDVDLEAVPSNVRDAVEQLQTLDEEELPKPYKLVINGLVTGLGIYNIKDIQSQEEDILNDLRCRHQNALDYLVYQMEMDGFELKK